VPSGPGLRRQARRVDGCSGSTAYAAGAALMHTTGGLPGRPAGIVLHRAFGMRQYQLHDRTH
jgi:hypothetical protein